MLSDANRRFPSSYPSKVEAENVANRKMLAEIPTIPLAGRKALDFLISSQKVRYLWDFAQSGA